MWWVLCFLVWICRKNLIFFAERDGDVMDSFG
jgi:hypothetical protein